MSLRQQAGERVRRLRRTNSRGPSRDECSAQPSVPVTATSGSILHLSDRKEVTPRAAPTPAGRSPGAPARPLPASPAGSARDPRPCHAGANARSPTRPASTRRPPWHALRALQPGCRAGAVNRPASLRITKNPIARAPMPRSPRPSPRHSGPARSLAPSSGSGPLLQQGDLVDEGAEKSHGRDERETDRQQHARCRPQARIASRDSR